MLSYLSENAMKRFRFKSIRTKLIFWFLTLGILPLIIGITMTWKHQTLAIKKEGLDKLVAIRTLKTHQLESWLNERVADLNTIASDNELRQLEAILFKSKLDPEEFEIISNVKRMLNLFVQNYTAYEEIFIINPRTGVVEISTNHNAERIDRSQNPYFTQPMRTRKLFIKNIHFSKFLATNSMTFSQPIFCAKHSKQHIVGIMVARINLKNSLYALLEDRVGLGRTGESFIINQDGIALSELRWHEKATLKLEIQAPPTLKAAEGKIGVIESLDYRGQPVLAAYTHIPQTGWGLVVKQDLTELHAPIQAMMQHFLVLIIGVLVTIIITVIITAKAIATPIIEMAETAQKIKAGDLSARNHMFGSDELTALGDTFNTMAAALESQVQLRKINDDITHVLVEAPDLNAFRYDILKKLVSITDSQMGAYFFLNRETHQYEPFTSIGIMPSLLGSFDSSALEGEIGRVITDKKIIFLKDIPQNTIFQFKTFTGTMLPREIITIPVIIDKVVSGIVSLARIKPYDQKTLDIMKQPWTTGMSTALSNMTANAETKRLASKLQTTNQELQAQTEELALQARELQHTTEELQQQNQALEIQKEKVQEANRLKSEFLSNMSHELRTPLNSVMALSRVLIMQAKNTLSEEELSYLEIIERNGKNLLSLINDILDLAKIEAGRMEIISRYIHVEETIETIIERLEPIAREKGIRLLVNIDQNPPPISCDENRLHQILQNIMGNAVKFTSCGSVTVTAYHDRHQIHIKVSDTGIGIAKKDLPHIFEEFRQVDGTAARNYEGTGLGLAIAYKTACLMGGDISVESTPGKGTTFILSLPIAETQQSNQVLPPPMPQQISPPAENPEPCSSPQESNHKKRLLVVEDNESAVIQIKMILENAGYHVDVATSGQQALNYIAGTMPDGIILDLMMPGIDGFQVLEKMRSTRITASIPVLILTARDLTPEDLNKLTSNHIQQLVQKGDIDAQGLLAKIKAMLGTPEDQPEAATLSHPPEPSAPEAAIQARPMSVSPTKNVGQSPTILIVEDNPDNMVTLKAILGKRYTIQEAANGKQGLHMALTNLPDLILLDISLPEMDGYGVVEALKKEENAGHIPVIALTAHVMKGDKQKIMDAGCDDYISKPVNPATLIPRIEKWIKHAQNISH